ncbi:MAG: tetratricopeptide repeat protein [Nitrospinales bacterium]
MSHPNSEQNQEGVNKPIKIFVIILTVITFIAFVIFMYLLVSKIFSSSGAKNWDKQLLQVGDRLKSEGLREEAIEQYRQFLSGQKIDPVVRAEVSHSIGDIYREQGNCRQALVWFFQAELADAETSRKNDIDSKIAACRRQLKSLSPAESK